MNILIKPASGACNMRCRYCFYADEMSHRERGIVGMMSTETLDVIVKKTLETAPGYCTFMFQGGEPTLTGLDFYRHLIDSVKAQNTRGVRVSYAIQTNGYTIDENWAKFFSLNHFLVGLSLDGTRDVHDQNRLAPGGKGTFDNVSKAASLFEKHHVEYNILTVVTQKTARYTVSIYNYFKKQGYRYQQYIPCIEGFGSDSSSPWTLTAEQYGRFLCRMFDIWYQDIISGHYIFNRTFENWIGILIGRPPESCGMVGICSPQYVVEADGSVYPCDFYVLDEYKLGNLICDSFADIDKKRAEIAFIDKSKAEDPECLGCRWKPLCRGGCRREREPSGILMPGADKPGSLVKNRFCESYRVFFPYAYDRLVILARSAARGVYGAPQSEKLR
jgi:uncharacterized protein